MRSIMLVVLSVSSLTAFSQTNYFSKLIVDDVLVLPGDSSWIDSLMMGDRSRIRFLKDHVLTVNHAFIGSRCVFDASGTDGFHGSKLNIDGGAGTDASSLVIYIRFNALGDLTVKTKGGNGGNGLSGVAGIGGVGAGTPGGNAGNGGDGGDAGDLILYYNATGFLVSINRKAPHAIFLNAKRGFGGKGGKGGKAGRSSNGGGDMQARRNSGGANAPVVASQVANSSLPAANGLNGNWGRNGKEGEVVFLRKDF